MLTFLTRSTGRCLLFLPVIMAMLSAGWAWAGSLRVPGEFANIQLAIDSASPRDTVFVEAGTYTGEGNRNLNFRGKDIVLWGVDGPAETIIDCEGSETENARGFIFESGERFSTVVAGFTIRRGYQQGTTWETAHGGGMLISGAGTNPTIKKCYFFNNSAFKTGGGVAIDSDAAPTFFACIFEGNIGRTGGGGAYTQGDADFIECDFIGNESNAGDGGALKCRNWSESRIRDCFFRDNFARHGGALAVTSAAPVVAQCDFVRNTATFRHGGAVYTSGNADLTMSNCVFAENTAEAEGGAVCCDVATVDLDKCTFFGNSAPLGAGVRVRDGSIQAGHTIIAFSVGGESVACTGTGSVTLNCCDLFGNEGGDWVGCIAAQADTDGNMSADPLFCNVGHRNFRLAESSPCGETATECGLIGRHEVGCTSAVEEATWGAVKALYRR